MDLLKTRKEAVGLSDGEVETIIRTSPTSPHRAYYAYEIARRLYEEMQRPLSPCTPETVSRRDGIVEGLKIAAGILDRHIKQS